MNTPIIKVENLCLRRSQRTLVSHLHFEITKGSFVAIVGPSGVGKTTLLSYLSGILSPEKGSILYFPTPDVPVEPLHYQRNIAMVFQNFAPLCQFLCYDKCSFWYFRLLSVVADVSRISPRREKASTATFGRITSFIDESPEIVSASGGEQQRVALARALMQNPQVVFADEPVSHLDERNASRCLIIYTIRRG